MKNVHLRVDYGHMHAKKSTALLQVRDLIRRWWAADVYRAQNPEMVEFRARYFEPRLCVMQRRLHLIFRHTAGLRSSAGRIAAGVDVRATGAYIIWWPAAGLPVSTSRTSGDGDCLAPCVHGNSQRLEDRNAMNSACVIARGHQNGGGQARGPKTRHRQANFFENFLVLPQSTAAPPGRKNSLIFALPAWHKEPATT